MPPVVTNLGPCDCCYPILCADKLGCLTEHYSKHGLIQVTLSGFAGSSPAPYIISLTPLNGTWTLDWPADPGGGCAWVYNFTTGGNFYGVLFSYDVLFPGTKFRVYMSAKNAFLDGWDYQFDSVNDEDMPCPPGLSFTHPAGTCKRCNVGGTGCVADQAAATATVVQI